LISSVQSTVIAVHWLFIASTRSAISNSISIFLPRLSLYPWRMRWIAPFSPVCKKFLIPISADLPPPKQAKVTAPAIAVPSVLPGVFRVKAFDVFLRS
jgi:hypothetical protein